jgi:serine protease Do
VVVDVERDGPAAEVGIRRGDLVLEVNQLPIRSLNDYRKALSIKKAGEPSLFWVKRGENTLYFAIRSEKK